MALVCVRIYGYYQTMMMLYRGISDNIVLFFFKAIPFRKYKKRVARGVVEPQLSNLYVHHITYGPKLFIIIST